MVKPGNIFFLLVSLGTAFGFPGDLMAQEPTRQQFPPARTVQKVKDFVKVEGTEPIELKGYGVVIGLNGNGDSPGGETEKMILNFLRNHSGRDIGTINIKSAAAVIVSAILDPFQKPGTRIDVSVEAYGDAKSLNGGRLLMTPMTDMRKTMTVVRQGKEEKIITISYAVAEGRLIINGDARTGNPTAAYIPRGGVVKSELKREVLKRNRKDQAYVTLNLRRPDFNLSTRIAEQLNQDLFPYMTEDRETKSLNVASVVDAGSVVVFIPDDQEMRIKLGYERPPPYRVQPALFLDRVLDIKVPILTVHRRALVTIDATTKAISWGSAVMVRAGSVRVSGLVIGDERKDSTLSEVLDAARQAASHQTIVDIVLALDRAGLLEAEVISR